MGSSLSAGLIWQGTRRACPTGVVGVALASRVLLEPFLFFSPLLGGGEEGPEGSSGAQVCGFKMCGSRAVRSSHANMGGQIEFSMRRFQMNPMCLRPEQVDLGTGSVSV